MTTNDANPQLQNLLGTFCQSLGLPEDAQAQGVEFEAGDHVVLVAADPRSQERLLVDVGVGTIDEQTPALLRMLHQINGAARLEHDWVATIGAASDLRLHTQRNIASTDAGELQALLAEGIERAQALAQLCAAVQATPPSGTESPMGFDPGAMGMIRG